MIVKPLAYRIAQNVNVGETCCHWCPLNFNLRHWTVIRDLWICKLRTYTQISLLQNVK